MPIGWRVSTSQNNHNVPSVSEPFLYLFPSKNGIFHKFLYRTFWYSRNYTYFYFPKWRYMPRMVLKITNLHMLRYLPTYWLYLSERYTIDNQWCTHTASANSPNLQTKIKIGRVRLFSNGRWLWYARRAKSVVKNEANSVCGWLHTSSLIPIQLEAWIANQTGIRQSDITLIGVFSNNNLYCAKYIIFFWKFPTE